MGILESFIASVTFGFLASSAVADTPKPVDLVCATHPLTTSFLFYTKGSEVEVTVIHHNGTKYMPIQSGITTPHDLPMLAQRAADLERLGSRLDFKFDLSRCRHRDGSLFDCFAGQTTTINDIEVRPDSIATGRITYNNIAGIYDRIRVHMSLRMDGRDHRIAMEYPPEECVKPRSTF